MLLKSDLEVITVGFNGIFMLAPFSVYQISKYQFARVSNDCRNSE